MSQKSKCLPCSFIFVLLLALPIATQSFAAEIPECPNGGVYVENGIDKNADGVIDKSEVTVKSALCNGKDSAAGDPGAAGALGAAGAPGPAGPAGSGFSGGTAALGQEESISVPVLGIRADTFSERCNGNCTLKVGDMVNLQGETVVVTPNNINSLMKTEVYRHKSSTMEVTGAEGKKHFEIDRQGRVGIGKIDNVPDAGLTISGNTSLQPVRGPLEVTNMQKSSIMDVTGAEGEKHFEIDLQGRVGIGKIDNETDARDGTIGDGLEIGQRNPIVVGDELWRNPEVQGIKPPGAVMEKYRR